MVLLKITKIWGFRVERGLEPGAQVIRHEIYAGTRITISYPENLSFNVYVIYEAEASFCLPNEWCSRPRMMNKKRDGGFDMVPANKRFYEEKLMFDNWEFLDSEEVSLYSKKYGSKKMGLWKKTVQGGHNQSQFTLPAFIKTFTGSIVVQPLDDLYDC